MIKLRASTGVIALLALVAACSGDNSENKGERETLENKGSAPIAASAATSGPPLATDLATLDGTVFSSFTGDAAAGKLVFAQCRACHVTDAGVNKAGPSLNGIVGRKSGSVPGFTYSTANANIGVIWTKEKLFQYLEKPQRVIPKTKMIFAGLPDAQKRANLIAYLANPT